MLRQFPQGVPAQADPAQEAVAQADLAQAAPAVGE
jgi:hypothetical protein